MKNSENIDTNELLEITLINFNYYKVKIIAVDTKIDAVKIDIGKYNIELVPTFIFNKKEIELSRNVETPKKH